MNLWTLAQENHIYGFEGTTARTIFIVGFAGLLAIGLMMTKLSLRQWLLAGVLFITSLAGSVDFGATEYKQNWMISIQVLRPQIHLSLGIALTIVALVGGGFAASRVNSQSVLLFLMALYAGVMQFIHEDARAALEALGFAVATIPCVAIAASITARSYEGCMSLVKMTVGVSAAWTFCCSVQFIINPQHLVSNQGRYIGMLGNAQHTAAYVAFMAIICLWLFFADSHKRTKLFWATMFAVNVLFLIWTASRTGGLMFVIGVMSVLYTRLGKAVAFLPLGVLIVLGLGWLADALQINSNLERFINTENTRAGAWGGMLANALNNPLIGVGQSGSATENSYLGSFAAFGVVHFLLTISLAIISLWQCFRLAVTRRWLPEEQRPLVDIFVAFCLMYFGGAMLEGYIHARSFCPQVFLLIFACIGLWLRHEIADIRRAERQAEYAPEYEYDEDAGLAVAGE